MGFIWWLHYRGGQPANTGDMLWGLYGGCITEVASLLTQVHAMGFIWWLHYRGGQPANTGVHAMGFIWWLHYRGGQPANTGVHAMGFIWWLHYRGGQPANTGTCYGVYMVAALQRVVIQVLLQM